MNSKMFFFGIVCLDTVLSAATTPLMSPREGSELSSSFISSAASTPSKSHEQYCIFKTPDKTYEVLYSKAAELRDAYMDHCFFCRKKPTDEGYAAFVIEAMEIVYLEDNL